MPFFSSKMSSVLVAAGLLLAGCGSGGAGAPAAADASDMLASCTMETRAVTYMPSLPRKSTSGAFTAVLVSSVPGPPIKGSNDWTVQILDASGAPVDGLTMTGVPRMPDHTHPTSVKPVVTAKGGGLYDVSPVYLFMPGYWETTLTFQTQGGVKDTVVFPFCIPS
jgi:hypothetical protein